MLKLALLAPVVFALGGGAGAVTVEGASPVSVGKKATAYPVKCTAPIKFSAAGPGSLVVDVRGKTDALDKPLELDFTRNEKAVSKNAVMLKKNKAAGKGFAGMGQVVLAVPEGEQQYVIACDASSDIAMSFRLSKKAVKTNSAMAEVAVATPKDVKDAAAKTADAKDAKTDDAAKPADASSASSGGGASGGYIGVFMPPTTAIGF